MHPFRIYAYFVNARQGATTVRISDDDQVTRLDQALQYILRLALCYTAGHGYVADRRYTLSAGFSVSQEQQHQLLRTALLERPPDVVAENIFVLHNALRVTDPPEACQPVTVGLFRLQFAVADDTNYFRTLHARL